MQASGNTFQKEIQTAAGRPVRNYYNPVSAQGKNSLQQRMRRVVQEE